jgi:hypothetical protein
MTNMKKQQVYILQSTPTTMYFNIFNTYKYYIIPFTNLFLEVNNKEGILILHPITNVQLQSTIYHLINLLYKNKVVLG